MTLQCGLFCVVLSQYYSSEMGYPIYFCLSDYNQYNACSIFDIQLNETHPYFRALSEGKASNVVWIDLGGNLGQEKWKSTSKIHTLTSDLCDTYPGISTYNALNLGMQEINENAFVNCPQLEELNLSSNKIRSIDTKLFRWNQYLKRLSLNDNRLRKIDAQLFTPTPLLRTLLLSYNHLTDFPINDIPQMDHLILVSLQFNRLRDVDEIEIIKKFSQLNNFWIDYNKINLTRCQDLYDFFKARNIYTKLFNYIKLMKVTRNNKEPRVFS